MLPAHRRWRGRAGVRGCGLKLRQGRVLYMQVDGPSANTLPELESLVELLMEPVGREARQRLLEHLLRLVP